MQYAAGSKDEKFYYETVVCLNVMCNLDISNEYKWKYECSSGLNDILLYGQTVHVPERV